MKKILLGLFITVLFNSVDAQLSNDGNLTCYQSYAQVFEKRGAKQVEDGVHNNVIITFRKGSMAECYYGKVTVRDGDVVSFNMYLKFEDNTYEKVNRQFKNDKIPVSINGGMSRTMVTNDDELINVLFIKHLNPKKKAYVKAKPNFDL